MKSIILEFIKKFGVKMVLREIIGLLMDMKDNERVLARDIETALSAYERRAK